MARDVVVDNIQTLHTGETDDLDDPRAQTDDEVDEVDEVEQDGIVPFVSSPSSHLRSASLPEHLAPENLEALKDRVDRTYGAFGERHVSDAIDEHALIADNGAKTTLSVIAAVFLMSAFLYFVSHPAFDGPGTWANSFRLDTAFTVVWVPILFWMMAKLPLWKSLRIYLALALFIEAFSETMFKQKGEGGYWDSILWPAAVGFFGTIKELTGMPGASLPIFFFVTALLLHRAVRGKKSSRYVAPPVFARNALLVFLATVVALSLFGLARGGQIEWTFRQIVHMLQLPLVALVFLYALRVPEDLSAIGTAYVIAAAARSLIVAYVYFGVCVPAGITALPGKPEWCTNHSDTVLFVSALVILIVHTLNQRADRKLLLKSVALGSVILLGIVLNNRRLAFVSLGVAPLITYLALSPSRRKRRVTMALAVFVPLLVGYVLVGSEASSGSAIFKPARAIVSVLDQQDTSSISRDIENENLIYTLRQSPLLRGFGHEYESSPNNPPVDLSGVFQNYRLIAHNGVLWLWSVAGVIGFALLWFLYPLAGTLAIRGYRAAESPLEKSAALASLGCVAICVIQIWGDQGMNSYMTLITFGVAFAVASRLAVRTQSGQL